MFITTSKSSQITCSGANQCLNDSIICPSDEDCVVQCLTESSCSFSTIECPTAHNTSCSIYCHDDLSCNDMTIYAESVTSLSVHSVGDQSLSGSTIYCPSTLHTHCNITYDDDSNGLNDIEIYSIFDDLDSLDDTIRIQCASSSHCWSDGQNPVIHYGTDYSSSCTLTESVSNSDISVTSTCSVRPQLLTAQQFSTVFPVPIGTDFAEFESVSSDNNSTVDTQSTADIESEVSIDNNFNNALFLILIGLCGGFLISILCGVPCCYHWTNRGSGGGPPFEIKVNDKTPVIRPQRFKLTPSLQKLSPALAPADMELNVLPLHHHRGTSNASSTGIDGDSYKYREPSPSPIYLGSDWKPTHSMSPSSQTNIILSNLQSMGSLPSSSGQLMSPISMPSPQERPDFMDSGSNPMDSIIVTVGRYANESNECDESPVYSTSSDAPRQLSPYTLHDVYSAQFADLYKVTIGNPRDIDQTATAGADDGEFEVVGDSDGQRKQSEVTNEGQHDPDPNSKEGV